MNNKQVKTRFVFTGLSLLFIGILNLLAESSNKIKTFLILNKAIGPYSGKVLYGILIALVLSLIYYYLSKDSKFDIKKWTLFLFIILVIACLLIFTPFIDLVLNK